MIEGNADRPSGRFLLLRSDKFLKGRLHLFPCHLHIPLCRLNPHSGGDIANCSCSVGGTGCEKLRHKIVDLPWPVAFRDGVLACPKSPFLSPNDPDTGRLLSRNLVTASHVSGLLAPPLAIYSSPLVKISPVGRVWRGQPHLLV